MGRCPASRLSSTDPDPRRWRIFRRDVAIVTCRSLYCTGLCICWTEAASTSVRTWPRLLLPLPLLERGCSCLRPCWPAAASALSSAGAKLLLPLPLLERGCSCLCPCLCSTEAAPASTSVGPRLPLPLPLLSEDTSAGPRLFLPPPLFLHLPLLDRTTSTSSGPRLPAASCAGCPHC